MRHFAEHDSAYKLGRLTSYIVEEASVPDLDALDLALLTALRENPRAGALALSRLTRVARATVESRLSRLERAGVITGYGPDIDVAAAGFTVLAFVTLEIAQGALDRVQVRPRRDPRACSRPTRSPARPT